MKLYVSPAITAVSWSVKKRTSTGTRNSRYRGTISTHTRNSNTIGKTHQPELLLFRELALLFTKERVAVLGEVFVDLLVHVLLLGREFWEPSISFRLRGRNWDVVYGGHGRRWRWEGIGRGVAPLNERSCHQKRGTGGRFASLDRMLVPASVVIPDTLSEVVG